jgi:molybdenum cofactor guanylyltransferase
MKPETTNMKCTGIILCGGKSTRMGKNKALLKLGVKTLVEHVADTLSVLCNEIILSTNSAELDFLPHKKVQDKIENIGPIAGFYSALLESKTDHNLIVSCDTPFISSALLSFLLNNSSGFDTVLPVLRDQLQPMVGYFHKNMVSVLESAFLAKNYKPINIFENSKLNAVEVNEDLPFYSEYSFFNINSQEDYEQAKVIYREVIGG